MSFSPTFCVQIMTLVCIAYPLGLRIINDILNLRLRVRRICVLFLSFSAIGVAVILGSRSGILSIFISMFVMLWYSHNISKKVLAFQCFGGVFVLLALLLYFIRQDAADGRLLVYQVMLMAIAQKPLTGFGWQAFHKSYMFHQAEFFSSHPYSRYALLADNVYFPYNEFLGVAYRYGIPVLLLLLLLSLVLWKKGSIYFRAIFAAFCMMCMFSYPVSSFIPQQEMIESFYEEAALLNEEEKYAQSDSVLAQCQVYFNNYDTELLAADNALQQCRYNEALYHLNLAANMIPCRFYPLYGKMLVFQHIEPSKADSIAKEILIKQVKIPSTDIEFIKQEARQHLGSRIYSIRKGR